MGAGKDINGGDLGDDATDLSIPWDKAMPGVVQSKSLSVLSLRSSLGAYGSLWTPLCSCGPKMTGDDLEFSSGRVEAPCAGLAAGLLTSTSPEAENLTLGWAQAPFSANSWNGEPVGAARLSQRLGPGNHHQAVPEGQGRQRFESITRQWALSSRPSIELRAYRYVLTLVCGRTIQPGEEVDFPRLRSARLSVSKPDCRLYRSGISCRV